LRGFFTPASGHTGTAVILNADFVTLSSGTIARCATNQNGAILGLSRFAETQTFAGSSSESSALGVSQAGTLLPSDSIQVGVDALTPPNVWLEMSLLNTVQWTGDTLLGTQVGLLLDTATNLFVADSTQSNKVAVIREKVVGPNIFLPSGSVLGAGQINDFGVRVYVELLSASLQ
jgi:hypothetical protein